MSLKDTPSMGKKITIEKLSCLRCKHQWWPEIDSTDKPTNPKTCPNCKSPYWSKPVVRKTVSEARKK